MVRTLSNDCAGTRRIGSGGERTLPDRQIERRRKPADLRPLRYSQHPDHADLQKWRTHRYTCRRTAQAGNCGKIGSSCIRAEGLRAKKAQDHVLSPLRSTAGYRFNAILFALRLSHGRRDALACEWRIDSAV